jgi:tetratricopeptide (TPR) repeat protein
MGDTQKVRTQTKKGLEYVSKAVECFGKANDTLGFIRAYNNMGIIYRDLDETKKAMEAYQTGLGLAKRAGIENTGVGILNANLGQLYIDEGRNIPKGIGLLKDAIVLHEKFNNQKSMEHANRNLAYAYRHLKKYDEAILYAQKAVVISEILQDPHRAADSYLILYLAQKDVGKDNEALVNLEKSKEFADVAMRLEKTKSIAEMEAKYETVKKDASIDVLNKNAELDRTKKLALLVSLALLTIIAAFVVIGISQKRKRDNEIFAQENAVEEEKRKSVEQELFFKKKELTAKVLQLARKNEFLGVIDNEINNLKNNVDVSVIRATEKIGRMIQRDILDDDQWEQFNAEFSSLHQGYLESLISNFGALTKNEVRLISLLKMNLSNKEIADTLNISNDGIKKARYRLRKKLQLESDEDLHGFLQSYS